MSAYRKETDLLGDLAVPADVLYGIYTARAIENFPLAGRPAHRALIHAYGAVKLACARTNRRLGYLPDGKADAIEAACREMMDGRLTEEVFD